MITSSSVFTTFSVLALLMLTLFSLKMSQLKSIPNFNSLANHTKSFHCFTFILFVRFVVQPLKVFHKTTSTAFLAFLLLSPEMLVSFSSLCSARPPATKNLLPECQHREAQIIPVSKFSIGFLRKISLLCAIFKSSLDVPPTAPASGIEVLPSMGHEQCLSCSLLLCTKYRQLEEESMPCPSLALLELSSK